MITWRADVHRGDSNQRWYTRFALTIARLLRTVAARPTRVAACTGGNWHMTEPPEVSEEPVNLKVPTANHKNPVVPR
jgi:hypothetical protein